MKEYHTLVCGIALQRLFQQVSAFLILPQIEQASRYHENIVQGIACFSRFGVELVVRVSVVRNERPEQKRSIKLLFGSDA